MYFLFTHEKTTCDLHCFEHNNKINICEPTTYLKHRHHHRVVWVTLHRSSTQTPLTPILDFRFLIP